MPRPTPPSAPRHEGGDVITPCPTLLYFKVERESLDGSDTSKINDSAALVQAHATADVLRASASSTTPWSTRRLVPHHCTSLMQYFEIAITKGSAHLEHAAVVRGGRRDEARGHTPAHADLAFGRIVTPEIELQKMVVNLV
jgi:hypothetical protein